MVTTQAPSRQVVPSGHTAPLLTAPHLKSMPAHDPHIAPALSLYCQRISRPIAAAAETQEPLVALAVA
jgi:hypothetical protein